MKNNEIIIEKINIENLIDFIEIFSDKDRVRKTGLREIVSEYEALEKLKLYSNYKYNFSINLNNKMIGVILCPDSSWSYQNEYFKNFSSKMLIFILNKNYQGKGYIKKALDIVTENLFKNGIDLITCEYLNNNIASKKTIERNNFIFFQTGHYFSEELNKTFLEQRYVKFNPKIMEKLRKDIDRIDSDISELILEREEISKKVGIVKLINDNQIEVKDREKIIFDNLKAKYKSKTILKVFYEIIQKSKEIQIQIYKNIKGRH